MTNTDHIVDQILTAARRKPGKDPIINIQDVKLEIATKLGEIMDQHRQGEIDRENGEYWKARGKERNDD